MLPFLLKESEMRLTSYQILSFLHYSFRLANYRATPFQLVGRGTVQSITPVD